MNGNETAPEVPVETAVAFPAGTDVVALARAWFPEAEQLEQPAEKTAVKLVGARFGGRAAPQQSATSVPGLIRVNWEASLRGPLPASAAEVELPAGVEEVYRIESGGDPRFSSWLAAATRRARGAVLDPAGAWRVAHPYDLVQLTVHAADLLPPQLALSLVRSVAPMMQPVGEPQEEDYRLALATSYDGTVTLHVSRAAEMPVCLLQVARDSYGPFAYELTWTPVDAAAADRGTTAGRIARDRIVPLVSRIAVALRGSARGTVVDGNGFTVGDAELAAASR